jgi:hypothetical protein
MALTSSEPHSITLGAFLVKTLAILPVVCKLWGVICAWFHVHFTVYASPSATINTGLLQIFENLLLRLKSPCMADILVCNYRSLSWSLAYCRLFLGGFQYQDELARGGLIVEDQCFNFEAGFGIALNPVLIVSNYWFNNQESRHPVSRNCLWGLQSMKREHAFFHLHWVHHISLFSMP